MPWYPRVQRAINALLPSVLLPSVLLPTQATNLALLVSALVAKRTLCLSELARSYPRQLSAVGARAAAGALPQA